MLKPTLKGLHHTLLKGSLTCQTIYLLHGGLAEKTWKTRSTENQGDDSLSLNDLDLVPCPICGKKGYVDSRKYDATHNGYLCARCSNPHIDWAKYDKKWSEQS